MYKRANTYIAVNAANTWKTDCRLQARPVRCSHAGIAKVATRIDINRIFWSPSALLPCNGPPGEQLDLPEDTVGRAGPAVLLIGAHPELGRGPIARGHVQQRLEREDVPNPRTASEIGGPLPEHAHGRRHGLAEGDRGTGQEAPVRRAVEAVELGARMRPQLHRREALALRRGVRERQLGGRREGQVAGRADRG